MKLHLAISRRDTSTSLLFSDDMYYQQNMDYSKGIRSRARDYFTGNMLLVNILCHYLIAMIMIK